MKILYHGPLGNGSTSRQRAEAFGESEANQVYSLDVTSRDVGSASALIARVCWRLGLPMDAGDENRRLIEMVAREQPDVLFVDNSKVIRSKTLVHVKRATGAVLAYYSPDDMMAPHNLKRPLRRSFGLWDVIFTTKTFNVQELLQAGVRNAILVGNSFHPTLHRPLSPVEVGAEYEAYDCVFIGAFETERAKSIYKLANAGFKVLVHGTSAGLLHGNWAKQSCANITFRPPVYGDAYVAALHHGKVALCFLRKINRDRITTRSIEIPASARPMIAEKTDEHDAHFDDDREYLGFRDDDELIEKVGRLLADPERRQALAAAGRRRCVEAGYSTTDRARQMIAALEMARARAAAGARKVVA